MRLLTIGCSKGLSMSTRFLTAGEFAALDKWYVIDAAGQVLGRVATRAATILSGKHRPQYAPFLVSGDHVIIINAEKIKLTGEKLDKKVYRWHTRYPGGLREIAARKVFETRPDKMVREAVLGRSEEHTSELQSPCNLVCRLLLEKKKSAHSTSRSRG